MMLHETGSRVIATHLTRVDISLILGKSSKKILQPSNLYIPSPSSRKRRIPAGQPAQLHRPGADHARAGPPVPARFDRTHRVHQAAGRGHNPHLPGRPRAGRNAQQVDPGGGRNQNCPRQPVWLLCHHAGAVDATGEIHHFYIKEYIICNFHVFSIRRFRSSRPRGTRCAKSTPTVHLISKPNYDQRSTA